ncbi:MAG: hypothetical protein M1837_002781 [Sclerophora amabilis]|nr:MAG: hypothetical protein M1837_002781 [Sclerophora amabilis]
MSSPKRACDACHRRKVRCLGGHPCTNCSQASLACTFLAIPRKKGPKGSRAKIISELRGSQQQPLASNVGTGIRNGIQTPPTSPQWGRRPGLLSPETMRGCIDFFFTHMYPTMPILHRETLEERLPGIDHNVETYCLVTSLCAFMMIQPGMKMLGGAGGPDGVEGPFTSGPSLLDEVLRVRKSYDYIETPTASTVITSFFIFACYFGLDKHNTAWFHLREATTLAQILGMQDESTYTTGDLMDSSRRRRLFWILFVTERWVESSDLTLHDDK